MKKKLLYLILSIAMVVGFCLPINASAKSVSVTYQAYANNAGWLSNVTDLNDFAGNFGSPMSGLYINLSEGNVYYQAHIQGGGWLSEITNRTDFSGNLGQPMDAIRIKTDTGLQINYRVHILGEGWLPYVTGYDTNDSINGYAGNMGQTIDGIQMYLTSDSPQSTTLQAPLNGQRIITSLFNDYRQEDNSYHNGVDISASVGEPVYPIQSGTVIRVSYHQNLGNFIDIQHSDSLYTRCQHLNSVNVVVGQSVNKNTIIGTTGNTGYSSGPHLHIEFRTSSDFRYGEKSWNESNWNFDVANKVVQMLTSPGNVAPAPDYYTLSFDTRDGSTISPITAVSGSLITAPANPSKTGYTFAGWFKNSTLTTPWNFTTDRLTENTTLYAKWNAKTYTVTFDSKGGSTVKSKTAKYNTTITAPTVPTKLGYAFGGWYTSSSLKTPWNFATSKLKGNTTLYAKWKAATPSTPTSLKAVSTNYKTITISWAKSANANQYKIYRSTSSRGKYSLVKTTTSRSYANTGLTAGKTYYYKVVAVFSSTGKASGYSAVISARVVPGKVSTPVVKKASSTSIKVSYTAVAGASGYEVYYSTSSAGTYVKATTTSATSYTKKGLSRGKTYFFKVRAYRTVNGVKIYGSFSGIKSVKL